MPAQQPVAGVGIFYQGGIRTRETLARISHKEQVHRAR